MIKITKTILDVIFGQLGFWGWTLSKLIFECFLTDQDLFVMFKKYKIWLDWKNVKAKKGHF